MQRFISGGFFASIIPNERAIAKAPWLIASPLTFQHLP